MKHFILEKHRVVPTEDVHEWIAWLMAAELDDRCRVAKTELFGGDVEVSTVFIGRNLGLNRLPLLFETMVFGGELDGHTRKYSCWQDAEEGHRETVEKVKESTCINGYQS